MRVGVIGVGSMGQNHARVYSDVAELVGVCDKDVQTGKAIAQRFGTSFYPSTKALLSLDLDAVSIATPTSKHLEIAREAIEAGVPALVEKPFTGDVEQAR
ncbi:MAG: Gfo/Idh/MocA family oxidoreductase, partial [Thermoplasmata archaeon]